MKTDKRAVRLRSLFAMRWEGTPFISSAALLCACVAFDVLPLGRLVVPRVRSAEPMAGALTFRSVARVIGPTLASLITIEMGVAGGAAARSSRFPPRFLMPVHCAGIPFILPFFAPRAPRSTSAST